MMHVPEYDGTLGPCPWCSSEKHIVRDDGLDIYGKLDEEGEHRIYAQCEECSQISPSYPTIEKLREEWSELANGYVLAWPTCPECGRPVVVTRGGETGSETWFTFCCWDGPDRPTPMEALRAFIEEPDEQ
jgi:hypothetical protein